MSTKPAPLQERAIIIIGGGTDAPGYKLVPDGHGGYKVVPVPGWNPEAMLELSAALSILQQASRLKQPDASKGVMAAVSKIAQSGLTHLAGDQAGGTTIVVMAG